MWHYERAIRHFTTHADVTGELTYLRDLTIRGVLAGSLTAHEVLCQIRPAAVAVSLLAEPSVADVAGLLATRIRAGAADDPVRWAELIDEVETWTGSLYSLLTGESDDRASLPATRLNGWTGHLWRPANIMLALAPPDCARQFFTAGTRGVGTRRVGVRRAGLAQRMAGFMPLSRALVDHTVSSGGTSRARMNLAGNAFAPDTVLAELLRWVSEPAIATAVRAHDFAGGVVRHQAFVAVRDRPETIRRSLETLLVYGQQQFLDLLAAIPDDDPVWLHSLIKLAGDALEPDTRRSAYARLAVVSEPEVVWSLELARVGSLEGMPPEVRASMVQSSVVPLVNALREQPFRDRFEAVNAAAEKMRRPELLTHPLAWLG